MNKANEECSTRSDGHRKSCGCCCKIGRRRKGSREVLDFGTVGYCKVGKRRVEGVRSSPWEEVGVRIGKFDIMLQGTTFAESSPSRNM
jgi:hypothetical protein